MDFTRILEYLLRRQQGQKSDVPVEIDTVEAFPVGHAPKMPAFVPPPRTYLNDNTEYQSLLEQCGHQQILGQIQCMQEYGCGQEERWDPDDENEELVLSFSDGVQARARYEAFAHLNENAKAFNLICRGAHTTDQKKIAARIEAYGLAHNIPELSAPILHLAREDMMRLANLAHHFDKNIQMVRPRFYIEPKCDYIALRHFRFVEADGKALSAEAFWRFDETPSQSADDALELVKSYCAEYSDVENDWAQHSKTDETRPDITPFLERKRAAFRKYWTPPNDDWLPISIGNSDYKPSDIIQWFVVPKRCGGQYVIPFHVNPYKRDAFLVELIDGSPHITNQSVESGCHGNWVNF